MITSYGTLLIGSKENVLKYFRAHSSLDIPSHSQWNSVSISRQTIYNLYYIDDFLFITVLPPKIEKLENFSGIYPNISLFTQSANNEIAILDAGASDHNLKPADLIYYEKEGVYLFQLAPLANGGNNVRMWCEQVFDDKDQYYYEVICVSLLENAPRQLHIENYFEYPLSQTIIPEELPQFLYHPDPVANKIIVPSKETCVCCEKKRGYIYTLGCFSDGEEYENCICPWCIADGSAAKKLQVEFFDVSLIPSAEFFDAVAIPSVVADELSFKTPSFNAWINAWYSCCNDAAEYLGPSHANHTQPYWSEACKYLAQAWQMPPENLSSYFNLSPRSELPTARIFRCRHCQKVAAYVDTD